ncbi:MAG TPA: DUF2007 domain-containing protein [Verrucomicrobiae bacterium]|jgi:transposase-like protein
MKCGKTVVATFGESEKANVVKTRLEESGIKAVVDDESKLQMFGFLSKPLASQKVYVDDADAEKARVLLRDLNVTDHILDGEVRCLECGSPRVEYPQFTRKFVMTTLVELGCFLGVIERRFYCTDCHFTWPVNVKLRKKTDILNWPQQGAGLVKKEKV